MHPGFESKLRSLSGDKVECWSVNCMIIVSTHPEVTPCVGRKLHYVLRNPRGIRNFLPEVAQHTGGENFINEIRRGNMRVCHGMNLRLPLSIRMLLEQTSTTAMPMQEFAPMVTKWITICSL